jgi:RNA polymerase sigma-70 factor (ECF subfamily)
MATGITDPDGALVLEHLDGEDAAFDVLYRRYFPRLVRLCIRMTRSQATAEDIAQETLIRAHAALERFEPDRPMWPWLKTIASRLLIDHARARSRELLVEEPPEAVGADLGPGHAERVAERSMLLQALSALPDRQRDAVTLRYLEDWDAGRVAEHLGMNGLAFRQILHRGRLRLQAEYRRLSEAALGGILAPVAWLKRTATRASARLQRATQQPAETIAVGVALNLVVAAITILGSGPDLGRVAAPEDEHAAERTVRPASAAEEAPGADRDRGPSGDIPGATSSEPSGPAGDGGDPVSDTGDRVKETVDGFVDPNKDVRQPEEASIHSMSHSPRFEDDGTVFAVGTANCPVPPCEPVLFRSTDAGASWARLPAEGFRGTHLVLPPSYPADDRIFAMGPGGLQVSRDGGETFAGAGAGPALGGGALAISPAFNSGDARILIGSQSLMEYRDETRVIGPTEPVPGRGPLYPSFSPDFARDGLVFVGGLQPDAGRWRPTVFRCEDDICSGISLPAEGLTTEIRTAPDFADSRSVYAFTENQLLVSRDAGETFNLLPAGWDGALDDLAVAPEGRLFAVAGAREGTLSSLHRSDDGGTTWTRLVAPLHDPGVTGVGVDGGHVVVALAGGGVACSADAGMTWASRCSAA